MNTHPRKFCARLLSVLVAATAVCASVSETRAIILFGTGDPTANTTAPTGSLANSGWEYEGQWGAFLGTPVAPHFFITAKHVGGGVGQLFYFGGVAYTTVAEFADPDTDLHLWQVREEFPYFAQLYTKSGEVGKPLVAIGRGTQRGDEIDRKRKARGWGWGAYDAVQRWGQNTVTAIVSGGTNNEYIYATFDEPSGRTRTSPSSKNEAQLSSGDSGGGVFLNDGGIWKLAAINYAVDGPLYVSPADAIGFNAALFDARDFYYKDEAGNYVLISGKSAVPTGFYSTRISSRAAWIWSVIQPPGGM